MVTIDAPRHRHSPLVRRLSKELGVDADSVAGTGPRGRVRPADLRAVAAVPSTNQGSTRVVDVSASRASARPDASELRASTATSEQDAAVRTIADARQLTSVIEVDVTVVTRLITRSRDESGTDTESEPNLLAFVAKATTEALRLFPAFNAGADRTGLVTYNDAVRLGIALDSEVGYSVRSIERADDLSVSGLARQIAGLGGPGARDARHDNAPTFTISDSGSLGTSFETPLVNGPQVAALGIGAVARRPAVVVGPDGSDTIAVRSTVFLSLSYDRRVVDARDAARFLGAVRNRLELSAVDLLLR